MPLSLRNMWFSLTYIQTIVSKKNQNDPWATIAGDILIYVKASSRYFIVWWISAHYPERDGDDIFHACLNPEFIPSLDRDIIQQTAEQTGN